MSKQSFDVFCPECNIIVEAKVIARGGGSYRINAVNPVDEVDTEYYGKYYSVCLCPRCDQPFLIQEALYGVPADFETVTEEKILYPVETRLPTDALPESVKTAYDQSIKAFRASLFESCVLMSRKCLEAICKTLDASGDNLNIRLTKLHERGHIDSRLLNWTHEIRLIGNEAAHDIEVPVSKQDARDVLDFTEAILIYIFSLTKRFEALRTRRLKPDGNRL